MCPSNPNCATHGAASASGAATAALGTDFGADTMLADAGINTVAKVVSDFTGLPQVPMGGLAAGKKEVHTDASGKLVRMILKPSRSAHVFCFPSRQQERLRSSVCRPGGICYL